jgi:membrane protease YdiL (CAAX protease family)
MVVAIAPVMTWLFNRTRGSLFLARVAHSSINASLAVFVVATRGRLGCVPWDDLAWFESGDLRSQPETTDRPIIGRS